MPRAQSKKVDAASKALGEVRALRRLVVELAEALYTHTRTDLAPDAALPKMRRIVQKLKRLRLAPRR